MRHPRLLKGRIPNRPIKHIDATEATIISCENRTMRRLSRFPDFSVVVWLRKTDRFMALKSELLRAAVTEPYESTEYQGMVDFHWSAANLPEAKKLAEALRSAAEHPELVLLRIMSRVDGVDSISIKDERRTRH
jgi:hypothetical protein